MLDVVVFERDGRLSAKRIAALARDMVEVNVDKLIVPDGRYFMLCDNAGAFIDSRRWEPVVPHSSESPPRFADPGLRSKALTTQNPIPAPLPLTRKSRVARAGCLSPYAGFQQRNYSPHRL
ncbi:MAG: S26 family signal peptidase [Clostridiales bacterium]|nr:S26 family signal peptidase [Clostridiales bacterium]